MGGRGVLRGGGGVLLASLPLSGRRLRAEPRLSRGPGAATGEPGGFGADEAGVPGGGGSRVRRLGRAGTGGSIPALREPADNGGFVGRYRSGGVPRVP